jgi:hypothetical protein
VLLHKLKKHCALFTEKRIRHWPSSLQRTDRHERGSRCPDLQGLHSTSAAFRSLPLRHLCPQGSLLHPSRWTLSGGPLLAERPLLTKAWCGRAGRGNGRHRYRSSPATSQLPPSAFSTRSLPLCRLRQASMLTTGCAR